ncbi:hypothetical protein ATANTOWER_007964, partial [Ataeniobius toweri]|nr:hypothetical protein [Ataeniobius toweri]
MGAMIVTGMALFTMFQMVLEFSGVLGDRLNIWIFGFMSLGFYNSDPTSFYPWRPDHIHSLEFRPFTFQIILCQNKHLFILSIFSGVFSVCG